MALVAGLLFGTSAALARTQPASSSGPGDLASLIQQRNTSVERLADRAGALSAEIEQLERQGGDSVIATDFSRQADDLAPVIGLGPVRGPALRVTLDDAGYSLETLPEGFSVDDVVVHQQDVQAVVNALWAGGAEAMMIQDQRIITSSAVQCVGNTLFLQGRVYSPPYTITAIGDIDSLRLSLNEDPIVENYRGWSDTLGLGYEVDRIGEVRMPAFAGTPRNEFVRVRGSQSTVTGSDDADSSDPANPADDDDEGRSRLQR